MYYNFNQYINLGANLEKDGCNFAIYVKNVSTLSLNFLILQKILFLIKNIY